MRGGAACFWALCLNVFGSEDARAFASSNLPVNTRACVQTCLWSLVRDADGAQGTSFSDNSRGRLQGARQGGGPRALLLTAGARGGLGGTGTVRACVV